MAKEYSKAWAVAPQLLSNSVDLKLEKKRDVDNLLKKHFGDNWRALEPLKFYVNILDHGNDINEAVDNEQEEEIVIEEAADLRI